MMAPDGTHTAGSGTVAAQSDAPAVQTRVTRLPAGAVLAGVTVRLLRTGALVWGGLAAVTVLGSALGYAGAYPDEAARAALAATLGSDTGIQAIFGEARALDTPAGFTAWRSLGILTLVGGVWGLLAGTRALRGAEDNGVWELLVGTGPFTPRRATAAVLAGLAVVLGFFWVLVALGALAATAAVDGISAGGALLLATTLSAPVAVFMAVGALTAQLAPTRARASALAGIVFGGCYLVRVIADSSPDLNGLRWVTPLGWAGLVAPLTGNDLRPLIPVVLLVAVLTAVTVWLAGLRDLGAGILPDRDQARPRTALLGGPTGLALRLAWPGMTGWLLGLALAAFVFGSFAPTVAEATAEARGVDTAFAQLGVEATDPLGFVGLTFLILCVMLTLVAAGQAAATRDEEGAGRSEHLLVRQVGRVHWFVGRLAVSAGALVVLGLGTGLAAWTGVRLQGVDVAAGELLAAGLNLVPPALLVLGLAALVHGAWPRATAAFGYGLVGLSFLLELVGSVLDFPGWLLACSFLHHVRLAPGADPDWVAGGWMVAIGLTGMFLGALLLRRRDVTST